MDIFEALDESALKLFSQALKPINTLVYGVQDFEAQLTGSPSYSEPTAGEQGPSQSRAFHFSDLKCVDLAGPVLQLEDLRSGIHSLPLASAPIGEAVRQALAAGLRTALTNANSMANWSDLHAALLEERRTANTSELGPNMNRRGSTGAGQRVLEVFEVERRVVHSGEWKTPFLPMDRELSFRWVDATGTRHPSLIKGYSCERCAACTTPPCVLSTLFRPTRGWAIDTSGATDSEGWKYGLAWNSSTWDTRPGLFDAIRKRRWTRTFE